jgi:hypothetical protein
MYTHADSCSRRNAYGYANPGSRRNTFTHANAELRHARNVEWRRDERNP